MAPDRTSAETWELLETTLELGDGLDYLLIECASPHVRTSVAGALQKLAARMGRPFRVPRPEDDVLSWLDGERAAAASDAALREARPIYFVPVPADNEGFVLARLNENRDNLVNDMRGALCLVGLEGLLDRLPPRAPSIWAYRTKTFSIAEPPPGVVAAPEPAAAAAPAMPAVVVSSPATAPPPGAPPAAMSPPATRHAAVLPASAPPLPAGPPRRETEGLEVARGGAPGPRYDVHISAAYRDEQTAEDLRRRLEADGIRCSFVKEDEQDRRSGLEGIAAQAAEARFIVPLLSPDYGDSNAWRALEGSREMAEAPDRLRARMLPVLVRDCVPPPFLSEFEPIDFRSPRDRLFGYPILAAAIKGWTQDERPRPRKLIVPNPLPVTFMATGVERASAVMQVHALFADDSESSTCSGFLIARDLLLTAHYALFDEAGLPASSIVVRAGYEADSSGNLREPTLIRGRPDTIVGSEDQGWAVLRMDREPALEMAPLVLNPTRPPQVEDRVVLVHHPHSGPKSVSLWGNIRFVDDDVFRYAPRLSLPGSGGAPVFNERWEVVGMTHRRVPADDPWDPFKMHSLAVRIEPIAEHLRARGLLP